MAYKALYRSYRPNDFSSVMGQEHIIKTLKNAISNNKISHAYIFSGPRGIGKTTIARILAKAINCENPKDGEPCNKCAACKMINNNETPDIVEFDAASNNGVEEIRNVLEKVNFLPSVLKRKVYIIDEAHMLSISAFNALLKTLEEPPVHVMFVLATTEPHKIPATILSRCQRFDFKPLTVKEIKENLSNISEQEKIAIEDEALNLIAETADGGMRDAIGVLDQVNSYSNKVITLEDVNNVTGRISNQKLIELMQVINDKNSAKAVELINELLSLGKEVNRIVQGLLQLCRDALFYQSTDGEIKDKLIYDDMAFKMLCNNVDKKKIFYFIDVLSDIQNKIKFSLSQKIFLEVGIMKMANASKADYDAGQIVDGLSAPQGALPSDIEDRLINLETHLNKMKGELVRLNLVEFKEKTEEKLNFLENNNSNSADYNLFEERLAKLEEASSMSDELTALKEEIVVIKTQIEGYNNVENVDTSFDKEELEKIEASIQLAFNQIDEISMRLKEKEVQEPQELTLFDFNQPNKDEEIEVLKQQYEELKQKIFDLQHTYDNVEASLNELVFAESEKEPSIQKRENPYEQKVLDIVAAQREIDEQPEEPIIEQYVQEDMFKDDENINETIVEEEVIEQTQETKQEENIIFEQPEAVVENLVVEEGQSEDNIVEEEHPELPEEMTRSIDDFFTNPVFFNKPLEESPAEEKEEEVKEEKPVIEQSVPQKTLKPIVDQPENKVMSLDDFEQEQEEELHYDLSCNIQQLEAGLRTLASVDKVPLDTLNYVILNLYNMQDDIKMFISDKLNGRYVQEPSLEKDANRNIKTFLITVSGRDAMVALTKDKEIKKLIASMKDLIKEFRNPSGNVVSTVAPKPIETLVVEEPKPILEEVAAPIKVEETPAIKVEEVVQEEPAQEKPEDHEQEVVETQEELQESPVEEVQEPLQKTLSEEVPAEEPKVSFALDNLIIKEEEPKTEEPAQPVYKRATILETTPKEETMLKKTDTDNPYAIEKIEMIMHDSRSEISREERKIILNSWQRLGDRVGTALSPVARFLMDGVPVVNGNNCIIITYPNAALCNHIMGEKIHFEAKQILKITFGREYDFIALPDNIWQEKRNEYRGQYQTGTRYPKLTPINNPELKIIKKSFVDEKNSSYNKALDLFGENLIKEEEE